MSRIAGIITWKPYTPSAKLLDGVTAKLLQPNWKVFRERSAGVDIGWCGWQDRSNLAKKHNVVVVIDGTIYNKPRQFETEADWVLKLYFEEGMTGMLNRLNGDFGMAVYDGDLMKLYLARDRFGVKPLYFVKTEGALAFASQPRCLLQLPGVSRQVNPKFVALYAVTHYRYFDTYPDSSPYLLVNQLPAAQLMMATSTQTTTKTYWQLEDVPDFKEKKVILLNEYRELLGNAVKIRLDTVTRPAFTLSGGLDSSSLLSLTAKLSGKKQVAFSAVYDDKTYDESKDIVPILKQSVSKWHAVRVENPDLINTVDRMISIHDEPVGTVTWLAHFLLSEQVKLSGYDGLVGGLGGDQLNGGEYEYFYAFFADLILRGKKERLKSEVSRWIKYFNHDVFKKSLKVYRHNMSKLIDLSIPGKCLPDQQRLRRYYAALDPEYVDMSSFAPEMEVIFTSYLKNRTLQELTREHAPVCLRAEDRHATYFERKALLPFFDYRLAEFMYRVPSEDKIVNGKVKMWHRRAMKGILPESTRMKVTKVGWNAPAHLWFSGKGQELLWDIVRSKQFRQRGIYNLNEVERIINDHQRIITRGEPRENHAMFLWQLINLELWQRQIES